MVERPTNGRKQFGVGATRCTKSRQGYDPRHPATQVSHLTALSLGDAAAAVSRIGDFVVCFWDPPVPSRAVASSSPGLADPSYMSIHHNRFGLGNWALSYEHRDRAMAGGCIISGCRSGSGSGNDGGSGSEIWEWGWRFRTPSVILFGILLALVNTRTHERTSILARSRTRAHSYPHMLL